jgi:hypothetical protein
MKKVLILIAFTSFGVLFTINPASAQSMGPGYGPPGGGSWDYCPYCGNPNPGWGRGVGPRYGPPPEGYRGYHPYCGRRAPGWGYGMGPGYDPPPGDFRRYSPYWGRRPQGHEMGPGMMERDYGDTPPYGRRPSEHLDKEGAENMVESRLKSSRNPNLKLGEIEDKVDYFEAEVRTKNDALVDKLIIDKETGRMRSVY